MQCDHWPRLPWGHVWEPHWGQSGWDWRAATLSIASPLAFLSGRPQLSSSSWGCPQTSSFPLSDARRRAHVDTCLPHPAAQHGWPGAVGQKPLFCRLLSPVQAALRPPRRRDGRASRPACVCLTCQSLTAALGAASCFPWRHAAARAPGARGRCRGSGTDSLSGCALVKCLQE